MKKKFVDTKPRKEPIQARARHTVEAMVEATARILRDEGPEACNTNAIAELAGVSIGTLYQYFPSGEALLAAVVERELAEDVNKISSLWCGVEDLRRDLEGFVLALLAHFRRPSYLALHARLLPLVPLLERQGLVSSRRAEMVDLCAGLLEQHVAVLGPSLRGEGELAVERRRMRVFMLCISLEAILNEAKVAHQDKLASPIFAAELVRLVQVNLFEEVISSTSSQALEVIPGEDLFA